MKKRIFLVLSLLQVFALLLGIRPAPSVGAEFPPALVAAAKKEGKLVIYCSHRRKLQLPAIQEFERLFGIKVDFTRKSTGSVIRMVEAERMAGSQRVDVVCIGDKSSLIRWHGEGAVIPYRAVNTGTVEPILRPKRDYINHKYTLILSLIYNTKNVSKSEVPKTWTDLLDPRWKDRIVLVDPGKSGSGLASFSVVLKKHGWDFFKKLAKNRPLVVRQARAIPLLVTSGERDIGPGSAHDAIFRMQKGDPIGVAFPSDVTPFFMSGTVVWKKGKHPNAAKLWMEFELSKFYQNLVVKKGYLGIRKASPLPKGMPELSSLNLMAPDYDWLLKNKRKVLKQFYRIVGKSKAKKK